MALLHPLPRAPPVRRTWRLFEQSRGAGGLAANTLTEVCQHTPPPITLITPRALAAVMGFLPLPLPLFPPRK